jgi:Fic/DOC family
MKDQNLAGGAWLVARYSLPLVMPLTVSSSIGGRRRTLESGGHLAETFVESMRPQPNLRGHLTFHLKHEVLHLEMLARLFEQIDIAELVAWIDDEPSGQYARRAGFLFEWLTGRTLAIQSTIAGGYVDLIDDQKLVAASPSLSKPNLRWRVKDNLPGTPAFCPVVRKTSAVQLALAVNVQGMIEELAQEFGDEMLMRSAVWMTLRESKASFAMEGEANATDRVQRFADVLARRTGQGALPLDSESLAQLQSDILGQRNTQQKFGIRQSPVFVGQSLNFQNVVHYIAPPAGDVQTMLEGLATFIERTKGQSAVMRSAVAAFGFVYIHPLADGNGRVHRLLINDILRRDGAIEDPMILPISSVMDQGAAQRRAYDQILDSISRPLMAHMRGHYEFTSAQALYPDGIRSNFVFNGDALARPVWRYLDLTAHVVYLADVIERTIREDMREESTIKRNHDRARAAIKSIIEMPDAQVDRVIRSAQDNAGTLTNALAKEIPALAEPGLWEDIVAAVELAFTIEKKL